MRSLLLIIRILSENSTARRKNSYVGLALTETSAQAHPSRQKAQQLLELQPPSPLAT